MRFTQTPIWREYNQHSLGREQPRWCVHMSKEITVVISFLLNITRKENYVVGRKCNNALKKHEKADSLRNGMNNCPDFAQFLQGGI